jgi:pimeloyl-ACP methyl ester carboxylesterase
MREKVLRFGVGRGLSGIVSEPSAEEAVAGAPAVVILNSGILHHVGASRLYVQMARRLAREGHHVLRFDFSGIGDSEARKDSLPFVESAPVETREAMDLLQQKYGVDRFILAGLCSGADMAFKVAGQDERVVGMASMDPYAYRTRGYYLRRYGPKLLNPMAYVASYRGRKRNAELARMRASAEFQEQYTAPEYRRVFPPREVVEQQLRALLERDVRILHVFSDGQPEHINHGAQYARAFPSLDFRDRLTVEYIRYAEHTFTELGDQKRVVDVVSRWARAFRDGRERRSAAVEAGAVAAVRA